MGLHASIFKSSLGDCSAGGISSTHSEVTIVNAEGPFEADAAHPPVLLVRGPGNRNGDKPLHIIAVPAEKDARGNWVERRDSSACRMAGGTILSTCDSRFGELIEKLGGFRWAAGVSFHDRFERGH